MILAGSSLCGNRTEVGRAFAIIADMALISVIMLIARYHIALRIPQANSKILIVVGCCLTGALPLVVMALWLKSLGCCAREIEPEPVPPAEEEEFAPPPPLPPAEEEEHPFGPLEGQEPANRSRMQIETNKLQTERGISEREAQEEPAVTVDFIALLKNEEQWEEGRACSYARNVAKIYMLIKGEGGRKALLYQEARMILSVLLERMVTHGEVDLFDIQGKIEQYAKLIKENLSVVAEAIPLKQRVEQALLIVLEHKRLVLDAPGYAPVDSIVMLARARQAIQDKLNNDENIDALFEDYLG